MYIKYMIHHILYIIDIKHVLYIILLVNEDGDA